MFILNRNQCSFWTGIGVQIGPEYALAEQGLVEAQYYIGVRYVQGTGVPKNGKEAALPG